MVRVVIELRPLMAAERILDRELVELELRRELVHVRGCRLAVVDPHDRAGHRQELGDVRDRKVLLDQLSVAVRPGVGHVCERARQPDRRSVFFFCLSARFSLSDLPGFFALCFSGTLFAMPPAWHRPSSGRCS